MSTTVSGHSANHIDHVFWDNAHYVRDQPAGTVCDSNGCIIGIWNSVRNRNNAVDVTFALRDPGGFVIYTALKTTQTGILLLLSNNPDRSILKSAYCLSVFSVTDRISGQVKILDYTSG